jgi:3-hydroxyisobutyrate dehydrogenase-like beta-hydroxyacid dehydrogenase
VSDVTPAAPVIGLVSAGEMGSALGGALQRGGATVLTPVAGRSERTRRLAERAGLGLVDDLDEVVRRCSVLLSVVPPHEALPAGADLVERARRLGVRPMLADLNAVAPTEVVTLAARSADAGLPFVDGALSGAPPGTSERRTRLLLAGPAAGRVAELPWTDVAVTVVGDRVGAASAAKMCTGGVRKGTTALLINALLTAAEYGVLEPVEAELRRALGRDPVVEVELAASKAWRFVPEMQAVAETQAAAGLDPATYRAIAEVFERTAATELAQGRPEDVARSGDDAGARLASLAAKLRRPVR